MNKSLKKFLPNLLLLLISLLVCFIALEVFVRFQHNIQQEKFLKTQAEQKRENEFTFFEFDPYLGWKNKPNTSGEFQIPGVLTQVSINSKGLRDKEYPHAKESGKKRILVLGDSFVWGYGVDNDQIFTELLEERLGPDIEVLNAGVSGYGTDQALLYLQREGVLYQPDIVILAFASNDFMLDNQSPKHGFYKKPYYEIREGELTLTNCPLPFPGEELWQQYEVERVNSLNHRFPTKYEKAKIKSFYFLDQLFMKTKFRIMQLFTKNDKIRNFLNQKRVQMTDRNIDLEPTKQMILRMKKILAAYDAELIVYFVTYESALKKMPNLYFASFKSFFEEKGIRYLDPYTYFLNRFNQEKSLFLELDDHWSPYGHQTAAESLYDYFKKEKVL